MEIVTKCDRCRKTVPPSFTESVVLLISRQTHWEPAEYDEEQWCYDCKDESEREREDERDEDYWN